jgi:hypothetical protein
MEIKNSYTRKEADFMSIVSATLKEAPNTFQGDSAYWDFVSVDFKEKELTFNVDVEHDDLIYYAMVGVAKTHGFSFAEVF